MPFLIRPRVSAAIPGKFMDTSKYKTLYLQEVSGHLSGIESGLLALEKNPSDSAVIDQLFRFYHSIKGMSASMGYMPIMKLAHGRRILLSTMRSARCRHPNAHIGASPKPRCDEKARERRGTRAPLDLDILPYIDWLKGLSSGPPSPRKPGVKRRERAGQRARAQALKHHEGRGRRV